MIKSHLSDTKPGLGHQGPVHLKDSLIFRLEPVTRLRRPILRVGVDSRTCLARIDQSNEVENILGKIWRDYAKGACMLPDQVSIAVACEGAMGRTGGR
jgi:hypothetical protein